MFVLILLSHIYGGNTLAVVPGLYSDIAGCEAAGKLFDAVDGYHKHICIPAPGYAP
jgi:hypothetical protein